jgi:hypothetical protein
MMTGFKLRDSGSFFMASSLDVRAQGCERYIQEAGEGRERRSIGDSAKPYL